MFCPWIGWGAMVADSQSQNAEAESVKESLDDELVEEAEAAGVDIDTVVRETIEEYDDYGVRSLARFAKSALESQIEAESAEEIKGLIMGSRDRHGKNWPRNHSILRSSGNHLEVSTFGPSVPDENGTEVRIPVGGAVVTMSCNYDDEYESYEGSRLEEANPLSLEQAVEAASDVALSPGDISKQDEYNIVAVRGTVRYVDTKTVFKDGDPHMEGPVLMEDDRGDAIPHIEITLESEGSNQNVRGGIERQSTGRPYIHVPDLERMCEDAIQKYGTGDEEQHEAQANMLQNGLRGMEVLMVGNVNNFGKNRNDGEVTEYVDIALSALVDVEAAESPQSELSEVPDTDDAGDEAEEPDEADETDEAEADDEADETDEADGSGVAAVVEDATQDIVQYCDLIGIDPDGMTVDMVRDNLSGWEDADEEVLYEALREAKEFIDGRAPDAEPADEPDESGDDTPLAQIRENGVLHCPDADPADDDAECLYQASSKGDLGQHAATEHGVDPDGLEEWVEANAEG